MHREDQFIPHLVVNNGPAALKFYKEVFGAEECDKGRKVRSPCLRAGFCHKQEDQIMRVFSSGVVLLLLALGAIAQTAPSTAKDAAELTKLLNEFLAGASRNDAAVHDRFWADDV